MLALPEPTAGGSLDGLRKFVNVEDDQEWRLLVHWLVMALHPRGPYPVLALHGEQGSAKSTATRVLRELVDPNAAPLRSEPREPRDLMIAASHGWVIALDNVSSLPVWLSDALCRLATGGGFSTRELYTDDEEVIFSAIRPIILNGIEEVVSRGDLMARALLVELPAIASTQRREEGEFWAAFAAARPGLLGALLDAVAAGLREAPRVQLTERPRMADFASWSVAVEQGLGWRAGGFMAAYEGNISGTHEVVIESSPVGQAVRALADQAEWTGTVAELLETLTNRVTEATKRSKAWPTSARALSGALRRLAPNLRAMGIEVSFLARTERGRQVRLAHSRQGNDRQNVQPRPDGPDGRFPTFDGHPIPSGGWEPDLEPGGGQP